MYTFFSLERRQFPVNPLKDGKVSYWYCIFWSKQSANAVKRNAKFFEYVNDLSNDAISLQSAQDALTKHWALLPPRIAAARKREAKRQEQAAQSNNNNSPKQKPVRLPDGIDQEYESMLVSFAKKTTENELQAALAEVPTGFVEDEPDELAMLRWRSGMFLL